MSSKEGQDIYALMRCRKPFAISCYALAGARMSHDEKASQIVIGTRTSLATVLSVKGAYLRRGPKALLEEWGKAP